MNKFHLLVFSLVVALCAQGSVRLSTRLPAAKVGRTAAVVICPGGGYTTLCDTYEGDDMARWLVERGVAAFVLRYRLAPKYHGKEMLEDVCEALRYVREHAAKLNVDPHRVGVLGFSAGGHLACLAGTTDADWRADFMALVYPHVSMTKSLGLEHMREKFLGVGATDEDIRRASGELLVNERTPPAFLVHARTDEVCSVEHSRRFAAAMREKRRPVDYLELESGRHGLGCGQGEQWNRWLDAFEKWLRGKGMLCGQVPSGTGSAGPVTLPTCVNAALPSESACKPVVVLDQPGWCNWCPIRRKLALWAEPRTAILPTNHKKALA